MSLKIRMGDGPSTNPEELLGSALAGCYSMSLANELAANRTTATSITSRATATVHFTQQEGGFVIETVDLDVTAEVPGIDPETFQTVARTAHEGCPVSRLFNADVGLTAVLGSR